MSENVYVDMSTFGNRYDKAFSGISEIRIAKNKNVRCE